MGEIVDLCPHELSAAFCSFCKQKPRGIRKREAQWGAYESDDLSRARALHPSSGLREAQYDTDCPWCTHRITAGAPIGNRDGEWICADCVETYDDEREHS